MSFVFFQKMTRFTNSGCPDEPQSKPRLLTPPLPSSITFEFYYILYNGCLLCLFLCGYIYSNWIAYQTERLVIVSVTRQEDSSLSRCVIYSFVLWMLLIIQTKPFYLCVFYRYNDLMLRIWVFHKIQVIIAVASHSTGSNWNCSAIYNLNRSYYRIIQFS